MSSNSATIFPEEYGPGAEILRELQAPVSRVLSELRAQTTRLSHAAMQQTDGGRNAFARFTTLMDDIRRLPYEDSCALLGIIDAARRGKLQGDYLERLGRMNNVSPNLASVLQTLATIRREHYRDDNGPEGFPIDALVVTRLSSTFGVNMVNPRFQEGEPPALSTKNHIALSLYDAPETHVDIHPKNDNTSAISYSQLKGSAEKPVSQKKTYMLNEGEAALLGRRVDIARLFNVRLADEDCFFVNMQCDVGDRNVLISRGAMMIVRQNDELYLFDRGMRNKLHILLGNGGGIEYTSGFVRTSDKKWTYGDSKHFRNKQEDPTDSDSSSSS